MGDVFRGINRAKHAEHATYVVAWCLWEARTTTEDPMSPNPIYCEQMLY